MEGKNVCSLFNGMGCIFYALEANGIKINKAFSSEIEKYPNQANDLIFPNTIQLGDVRNVKGSDLGWIDILSGGPPCQSFSFAGKRKGMSTTDNVEILTLEHYLELKEQNFEFEGQSYLFWEYMRIYHELKAINPDIKFLLENVVMGSKWQKILTQAIGINPIRINAALVSAQNRDRLFWTNMYTEQDGLFGDLKCMIPQPKDRGILLKDVLETFETSDFETQEKFDKYMSKYFLSDKMLNYLNTRKSNFNNGKINYKTENDTASCLNASNGLDISDNIIIDQNRKASCFTAGGNSGGLHSQMDLIVHNTMPRSSKTKKGGTGPLSRSDGKTYCLDTGNTNAVEMIRSIKFGRTDEAKASRKESMKNGKDYTPFQAKEIVGIDFEKMGTLTTSLQKDNLLILNKRQEANFKKGDEKANTFLSTSFKGSQANGMTLVSQKENLLQIGNIYESEHNSVAGRVYTDEGKIVCLSALGGGGGAKTGLYQINKSIRRLTPREAGRLQSVPEDKLDRLIKSGISDTQLYKMFGNGWNIAVVSHIYSFYNK